MLQQDGPNTTVAESLGANLALDMPSIMEAHLDAAITPEPITPSVVAQQRSCEFPSTGLTMHVEALTTAA
jgi:hypothetical protein